MIKHKLFTWTKWLVSPTLFISDHYKQAASTKRMRGQRVKRLNITYFFIALGLFGALLILENFFLEHTLLNIFIFILPFYCLSRCNEIFMAFVKDVFDKLNTKKRDKNGLEYFERIQLSLRSYIELIVLYTILFNVLSHLTERLQKEPALFNQSMLSLFDCLYFSVTTITSIGFGDIFPTSLVTKMLVIYEVINGMLLLVVSFTVYVNLTLDE